MKKFFLFSLFFFILMSIPLLAQDSTDLGDLMVKAQIVFVTGIGGLSVTALTELAKRLLKATGAFSVVISIVISIIASVFYLGTTAQLTIMNAVIYSALVALVANGIFKFPKKN